MDLPLRTRLLGGFLAVTLITGLLTVVAGGKLVESMVVDEAQRRVNLGLKTARSVLETRMEGARSFASELADWTARERALRSADLPQAFLERLREKSGYDFLHIVNRDGVVTATARGEACGQQVGDSPLVSGALQMGRAAAGIRLVPLEQLAVESPELAERAYLRVLPTPRAKAGGPEELREAMVLEAASPIIRAPGKVEGVVRVGLVLNRNFDLVDRIRENIFTEATYRGKNLGTVTIFVHDVRISTNVIGPDGERAIGTRISAEVYDQVLGRGARWIGPAFVVGNWYMSAYEPIRDPNNQIIGILYVGVLKDRYDDMLHDARGVLLGIGLLALAMSAVVGTVLAMRIAQPIARLTAGTAAIARGELTYRLPEPTRAERDEIKKLVRAFNEMAAAIHCRDEELRESHAQLAQAAEELKRWNQNYLDTLEFITHELKNQVAAMKINLLAVRDGYVGDLSCDQREAMDDVLAAVNRTEEMILNYLNLSRIEKGELEVRARPVCVAADVVQPVLRDLKARLDERGMKVQMELPDDLVVQADPSLLQIVYENLVSNAAKYGKEGGTVWFRGVPRNGFVELHVRNEGPGVPPDQLEELFRKFSRLQPPGEQVRGTGLGLYITREIVRTHGGDIWAEGEYGSWIDFVFTLPRPDVMESQERIG